MRDWCGPGLLSIAVAAVSLLHVPVAAAQAAPDNPAQSGRVNQPPARSPAAPRPPDTRRWEIEFHGGITGGGPAFGGSGTLPSAGDSFTTVGGSQSRRVPSWFFGDGASLLNDVLQSLGRAERITALDDVVAKATTEQATDSGFGVRVTRRMGSRWSIEVAYERAPATFTVTAEAQQAIEVTRNSFRQAFSGLTASGQGIAFTNPVFTSSSAVQDGTGSESLVTGAIVLSRPATGFVTPYVVAGGGIARASGQASASLSGRYAFSLPSGARVDETDAITIRFAGGSGLVFLAGGGAHLRLLQSAGVRIDARSHVVQNHVQTYVSSAAAVAQSLPADAIWSSLTPGIQFATHPSTNVASNLTAPALSDFRTLKGSGFKSRFSFTIGAYFRF